MNSAHLHLIINHFPVIGLVFATVILAVGQARRSSELARAGVLALIAIAVISIPVYLTGEPAEEIIEHLPGIAEQIVERHEEAALIALLSMEALGALALVGLVAFRQPKSSPKWFVPTLLVLAALATVWVAWTSSLGGQIRHAETRPDFVVPLEASE